MVPVGVNIVCRLNSASSDDASVSLTLSKYFFSRLIPFATGLPFSPCGVDDGAVPATVEARSVPIYKALSVASMADSILLVVS